MTGHCNVLLSLEFDLRGILHNIAATEKIAFWAYNRAEGSKSNLWHQSNIVQPIEESWREILKSRDGPCS